MNEHLEGPAEQRVVRVFVSSTFRDMQAERDELAKFIFPQLRKLCEQRGVTWGEVDLRWGITDELSAEGQVLPICLEEINRCRPYFIGLLGERYGWIPDKIPAELIERETWLSEHREHSVTELEILHGVLNNPAMARHTFFYFRDPKYSDALPASAQAGFREEPAGEEIKEHGQEEAEKRAQARRAKLQALKERIRKSGLPLQENYPDPKQLGEWVLRDLTAMIDRRFPEGSQPDPLERDASEHEVFAASRARVYIRRQAYFDALDTHARAEGLPLVVLGESGSGKSALLANWAMQVRKSHPDTLVLMHFIGATPASADWVSMLRRILGELKRRFDFAEPVPDQPDALRAAFASWLPRAAAKGRVILILDALNQLEDRDGAPDLVWLPPVIPANVRLVLSTLPGRPLNELVKRGWPRLQVEPLKLDERRKLVVEYLAQYSKALSPERVERIAGAAQCQNPLFLRVLLDELRLFGVHERLGERIEFYLKAATIPVLYGLILERCEQDYERERPGLVREAMSLVWAARRGLSEAELMDLLGAGEVPMPRAYWSPLYLALEQSLLSRAGLVDFFHEYLRQAVQDRYLPQQPQQKKMHLRLAEYFAARSGRLPRQLDELPWQLARAGEWQRLSILLELSEFFEALWEHNPFEVRSYWAQVEAGSPYRMLDAYRGVLANPARLPTHAWHVSILLAEMGHPDEARSLYAYFVEYFRVSGDQANLAGALGNKAIMLYDQGDLDGALALYREQESICRGRGDWAGLARSLGNQALILKTRGKMDQAMALHKEGERIDRELGNKAGLSKSLGNQALILVDRGELEAAMALHKEEERICREIGDQDGLSRSLANQANILYLRRDMSGALRLYQEEERICRELGNKAGIALAFGNQANVLYVRGDLDKAMALYKEQERICRELRDQAGRAQTLGSQALILKVRGDLDGAMTLHRETERIYREMGHRAGLAVSLGSQAAIRKSRGDLDVALGLYQEVERISQELGDKAGLADSYGGQANILYARGDLDGALALRKKQERIFQELGDKGGLAISYSGQAEILAARGDFDGAMTLHKAEERICREVGEKAGIARSFGHQALILKARGDLDGALALHKEEERMYRELGNKAGMQVSLGNQAIIQFDRGNLDGAMAIHQEEERIYRELGDKAGLSRALGGQGNVLYARGDLKGALALHKQEEQICRELGNKAGLQASLGNQGLILKDGGDLNGALTLHKESESICRELGDKTGLQRSLGNQALILKARGNYDGALALLREKEKLCLELGDKAGLSVAYGNQANILNAIGDLNGSLTLHKKQELICRELGNVFGLAISLINQAGILAVTGRPGEAHRMAEESLKLARENGYGSLVQQITSAMAKYKI